MRYKIHRFARAESRVARMSVGSVEGAGGERVG